MSWAPWGAKFLSAEGWYKRGHDIIEGGTTQPIIMVPNHSARHICVGASPSSCICGTERTLKGTAQTTTFFPH
eukprot:13983313-Ditylum_brightwellii.AAC.1